MLCRNSYLYLSLFPVDQRSSNSSSNIFKLLIDEPMTSKYWTSNNKLSVQKEQKEAEADKVTSCGDSVEEEDVVTIKSSNMDANEMSKNSIKRRPESLKLSFDYGSSTDLVKSATSTVDINQSKSMSAAASSKNHLNGKKPTSYDLWVNENVEAKERNNSAMGEKKLDLPGRVSFRFARILFLLLDSLINVQLRREWWKQSWMKN